MGYVWLAADLEEWRRKGRGVILTNFLTGRNARVCVGEPLTFPS